MRSYLTATLIPCLLVVAIGKLMAQSQVEVLCERTEFSYSVVMGLRPGGQQCRIGTSAAEPLAK